MNITNYLDMIWNGEISEDNIRDFDHQQVKLHIYQKKLNHLVGN